MRQQVEQARADSARERRAAKQESRDAAAAAEAKMREYVDRFREQVGTPVWCAALAVRGMLTVNAVGSSGWVSSHTSPAPEPAGSGHLDHPQNPVFNTPY